MLHGLSRPCRCPTREDRSRFFSFFFLQKYIPLDSSITGATSGQLYLSWLVVAEGNRDAGNRHVQLSNYRHPRPGNRAATTRLLCKAAPGRESGDGVRDSEPYRSRYTKYATNIRRGRVPGMKPVGRSGSMATVLFDSALYLLCIRPRHTDVVCYYSILYSSPRH